MNLNAQRIQQSAINDAIEGSAYDPKHIILNDTTQFNAELNEYIRHQRFNPLAPTVEPMDPKVVEAIAKTVADSVAQAGKTLMSDERPFGND